ncbi:aspartate--tRNA(Asn) ligase [Candidatus Micrarchaeota archaeon CG08_land_8_20_14_0_20_59_11]|nr:MAG: aspartate--tRNA(Asn) ligase [Candidatus Micrarchaeota archaeon CG08_land_8_20_14_0_20_59_11]
MMRTHYAADVKPSMDGKTVTVAGWTHETRDLGGLEFVILRDRSGLVQITVKKKEADAKLVEIAKKLVKETAIVCTGVVKSSKMAPGGVEIIPSEMSVVGEVFKTVPFEVTGKVPADLDVRLDNRFIDLRRIETNALFRIRSETMRAFRASCEAQGCQEITTPVLVSSSTEGGADVFRVDYFGKEAFLAQSPQLYKQLAVIGGMDRVFMVSPVFRAEKHNTTQHLNEVTQMDVELGFADEEDALAALEKTFIDILADVSKTRAAELKTLGASITVPKSLKRFTYAQAVDALNDAGFPMEWGSDFSKEAEARIPDALGAEAFFITRWPTKARAFYSMPSEADPEICLAYDLVYRGVEVASGAQRIHEPELLVKQLKYHGLRPSNFERYVDAFRYGAPPHAGWSIGCERLLMQLCNLKNIREAALFPRDRVRLTP